MRRISTLRTFISSNWRMLSVLLTIGIISFFIVGELLQNKSSGSSTQILFNIQGNIASVEGSTSTYTLFFNDTSIKEFRYYIIANIKGVNVQDNIVIQFVGFVKTAKGVFTLNTSSMNVQLTNGEVSLEITIYKAYGDDFVNNYLGGYTSSWNNTYMFFYTNITVIAYGKYSGKKLTASENFAGKVVVRAYYVKESISVTTSGKIDVTTFVSTTASILVASIVALLIIPKKRKRERPPY